MKKWKVEVRVSYVTTVEVEARNDLEAGDVVESAIEDAAPDAVVLSDGRELSWNGVDIMDADEVE